MEKGNSFGDRTENKINAVYESPYMPVTDPEIRKTAYKLTLYTDPTGTLDLNFRLLFDFDLHLFLSTYVSKKNHWNSIVLFFGHMTFGSQVITYNIQFDIFKISIFALPLKFELLC